MLCNIFFLQWDLALTGADPGLSVGGGERGTNIWFCQNFQNQYEIKKFWAAGSRGKLPLNYWRNNKQENYFFSDRPDRDRYIKILRENVTPEKLENFDKKKNFEIDSLGQPYDYYSIMHYRRVSRLIYWWKQMEFLSKKLNLIAISGLGIPPSTLHTTGILRG